MAQSVSQVPSAAAVKAKTTLLPIVAEHLGGIIPAKGLQLRKGNHSHQVWLESLACRLVLTWYDDDEVVCTLSGLGGHPAKGAGFELHVFLFARWGARAARWLPQYPDCGCGDRRSACLDALAAALSAGALDGPLGGDFGWIGRYHRLVVEAHEVGARLAGAMTQYRPEMEPLRTKWQRGDLSWIPDAKLLLAQY